MSARRALIVAGAAIVAGTVAFVVWALATTPPEARIPPGMTNTHPH